MLILDQIVTVEYLKRWDACYWQTNERRPVRDLAEKQREQRFSELLRDKRWPILDRIWVALCTDLIPDIIKHELGCKFAAHILTFYEKIYPDDHRPRLAIEAKRAWLRGEISDEDLAIASGSAGSAGSARGSSRAFWAAGSARAASAARASWAFWAAWEAWKAWKAESRWQLDTILTEREGAEK